MRDDEEQKGKNPRDMLETPSIVLRGLLISSIRIKLKKIPQSLDAWDQLVLQIACKGPSLSILSKKLSFT